MNIYLCPEVTNIKPKLIEKGYNIVENFDNTCDIIICDLKSSGFCLLDNLKEYKQDGTFVIDISNKNVEDLESIINNKVYSSLF